MTFEENNDEGFKVLSEKPKEIDQEEFFKFLIKNDSLNLTIKRVGKTFISKVNKNNEGIKPSRFFIDYVFKVNGNEYQVGISYNVGVPVDEETFILTYRMNLFKILEVVIDLERVEKAEFTKKFIEEKLTGLRFKATYGKGSNGGYIIKPIRKLE